MISIYWFVIDLIIIEDLLFELLLILRRRHHLRINILFNSFRILAINYSIIYLLI